MNTDHTGQGQDRTAELLSRALHEETAIVQTDPSALHEIQHRTRPSSLSSPSSRSSRSWVYAGLGAAAATATVIAGVALLGDNNGESPPPPAASNQSKVPVQEPTSPVVAVTYVGAASNDYRLFTELHSVDSRPGDDLSVAAVHSLLTGRPSDPDYSSGWPDGLDVAGVRRSDGGIQVDLTGPAGGVAESDPSYSEKARAMAVQALFRTAGAEAGDMGTITYNGDLAPNVLGVDLPIEVDSDDHTRAFLTIDGIRDGQTLDSPVTITVTGNVFEGNVNWELLDDSGAKVDEGYVTTSMGQWTDAAITLGRLDPGTYTLRAIEYSMKDGSIASLDDKTFTVS